MVGCVLWHVNPCGLFNDKSCLYTHTHTHIINSWNIDCDPGFHGVFCKKTIIRQLGKWNELKLKNTKKYRQSTVGISFMCGFLSVFFVFFDFDSFHLPNCLMIVVLQKTPWNPGSQSILHELKIYISNIYLFIIII